MPDRPSHSDDQKTTAIAPAPKIQNKISIEIANNGSCGGTSFALAILQRNSAVAKAASNTTAESVK